MSHTETTLVTQTGFSN